MREFPFVCFNQSNKWPFSLLENPNIVGVMKKGRYFEFFVILSVVIVRVDSVYFTINFQIKTNNDKKIIQNFDIDLNQIEDNTQILDDKDDFEHNIDE